MEVAVITVPLPAQGHLNQMLQFSCCLVSSSHDIPVYYVASALFNRQARARVNALNPQDVAKIHFHDVPIPPFASPPPNPNSTRKFPSHQHPLWDAILNLRQPVRTYIQDMSEKFKKVIVVHDPLMAFVVQDVATILNAESYAFNCLSAFSQLFFLWGAKGIPFPVEHPKELLFSYEELAPDDKLHHFIAVNSVASSYINGDIYNTCRLLRAKR